MSFLVLVLAFVYQVAVANWFFGPNASEVEQAYRVVEVRGSTTGWKVTSLLYPRDLWTFQRSRVCVAYVPCGSKGVISLSSLLIEDS